MPIEGDEEEENGLLYFYVLSGREEVEGVQGKHIKCLGKVENNVYDREEAGIQARTAARFGLQTNLRCLGKIRFHFYYNLARRIE